MKGKGPQEGKRSQRANTSVILNLNTEADENANHAEGCVRQHAPSSMVKNNNPN